MNLLAPVLLFATAWVAFLAGHLPGRLRGPSASPVKPRPRIAALLVLLVGALAWFESPFGFQLIAAAAVPFVLGILTASPGRPGGETNPIRTTFQLTAGRFLLAVGLLVAAALLIRMPNLGGFGVRLDEMYQYEAAVGYLETGRFVRWNFLEAAPGEAYPRAWIHTWMVAQAMKWLGTSLWTGRVVSLGIGLLLFGPVWQLCRLLEFTRTETLLVLFLLAVSPFCITASRWLRFYGLFMAAFLLMTNGLLGTFHVPARRWWFGVQLVLAGLLSFLLHPVFSAVVVPVLGVYLVVELGLNPSAVADRLGHPIYAAIGATALVLLLATGILYGDVVLEEFQFTGAIYPIYSVYLVQESLGYGLGGLFFGAAFAFFHRTPAERFLLCLLVVPTLLLIFFSGRFPQLRYLGFLIPAVLPVLVAAGGRLAGALADGRRTLLAVAVLLVLVLVPTRSLAERLRYIWRGNPGYAAFPGMRSPRYRSALDWLEPRLSAGDKVAVCHSFSPLIADERKKGIDLHGSPANRKLTREKLRTFEVRSKRVWILHAAHLPHCLGRKAGEYVRRRYRPVEGMPEDLHVRGYVGPSERLHP